MAIDPESVQASSPDEDLVVPLLSRSYRTKGLAVITTEAGPMEVTRRQTSRGEPTSISTGVVPSSLFQGRGSSSVEIMPSVEVPE